MKRFRENKVEQGYKKINWYITLDKLDKEIRNQGFGVLDLMVFNSLHDIMRERNFTTEEISWYYNEAHDLAVGAILKDEGGFNTDDICEAALRAVILGEDISPR